jgi:putative ABC transport system ATP-binding protein
MIIASNLSYTYTKQELTFPNFEIKRGEHTLLLGESGSGKTTLLHLLGGLLRNYNGSINFNSTELNSLSESELDTFRGKNIGFIFQKDHLINALTVEKNILLASYLANGPLNHARLYSILDELSIAEKRFSKVSELSHGQAQRVAIGRALINHPPVVFADEPTSALDDATCDRVISMLLQIASHNQATLVVATHDQRLKGKIERQINLT